MKTILLIFAPIIIIGTIIYVYLRREQGKIIPTDKYDEVRNEFYNKRQLKTILNTPLQSEHFFLLLKTFGVALSISILIGTIKYQQDFNFLVFLLLIPLGVLFSPLFPLGLSPFPLGIGYLIYPTVFFFGVFAKNRRIFTFIYIVFIILLILNIFGCAIAIEPNMLSSIN